MLQKFMEAVQAWITEHVVPVMNKLTSTYWFGVISDAVLYIVPFSMVSAIPSLWNIIRRFVPTLPDLSPLTTFSFGLVGLFMAFIIPHNVAVKEDRKDRSMIAGFTGIGAFMLCMNPTITEDGYVFQMAKFGAGGMFTAMVVGFVVGFIYKRMARMTFFSEDSMVPDFVKNWFDNIIAVLLSLFVAWLFTNMLQVDVFGAVAIILSPVTGFAQTPRYYCDSARHGHLLFLRHLRLGLLAHPAVHPKVRPCREYGCICRRPYPDEHQRLRHYSLHHDRRRGRHAPAGFLHAFCQV